MGRPVITSPNCTAKDHKCMGEACSPYRRGRRRWRKAMIDALRAQKQLNFNCIILDEGYEQRNLLLLMLNVH